MIWMYMHDGHPAVTVDRRAAFALALCSVVMVVLGLVPGTVLDWAQASLLSLAG